MSKTFDWQSRYEAMHSCFPNHRPRPVIGISGNYNVEHGCVLGTGYYESVLRAGGVPMILPPFDNKDALLSALDRVDGLLLSGGADLNPLFVGEEPVPGLHGINPHRDEMELQMVRLAFNRQIPMLGICRGIQMMVASLGGTLYQDLDSQYDAAPLIKHSQSLERPYASHTVRLEPDSMLRQIMQDDVVAVNSFHHQAVKEPGPHLRIAGQSPDGVIEAVESNEYKSILGVQWHPECFALNNDNSMMPIFEWLVGEASSFAQAKALHQRTLSLDSHCDTPMFFDRNIHFNHRDPQILVDLHKMTEGHLDASIMVAYLEQGERDEETLLATTAKTERILTKIEEMAAANCTAVDIARTPADLYRLKAEGKRAIMLGIENGYAIGRDLSLVEHFRQRGVVYMTLCHNGDNDICDSARGTGEHGGLSDFGRQVVREMNRVGMMVDLSHAAETSFYDALELSTSPIVCSHSSARALCDHPRNLTDAQMQALAKRGGVAQVTFYHGFLRKEGEASILDAIEHLNHMVNIMGIEHVGIGTDFDGDGGVRGLASASELINFTRRLLRERYSEEDIRLIWGGNFLRVMEQAQAAQI